LGAIIPSREEQNGTTKVIVNSNIYVIRSEEMPSRLCPKCFAHVGLKVFKRHGRSYVRCTACRAECTDKASRSVVRDGDGWGRDDENDVANTGTYDLEAVDDGDVVDVLLNLQSDNVASSETVQDASVMWQN
jgi:hypothetical protein